MTRTGKMILLLAALAVVLIGGLLAARFITKAPVKETKADAQVVSFDPSRVTELSWTNAQGSFALEKRGDAYVLKDDPAFPVDGERVERMLAVLSDLRSSVTVEGAAGKLSDYGLDPAPLTIRVLLEDGSRITVLSGDRNDLIGASYVMTEGSDTVYATGASLASTFTDRYGFMVWDELSVGSDRWYVSVETPSGVRFSATRVDDPIEIYYSDGYKWFATDSIGTDTPIPLDYNETAALCRDLASIRLAACVSYGSTAGELAGYGLDKPLLLCMKTRDEVKDGSGNVTAVDRPDLVLRVGDAFTGEAGGVSGEYRYAMVGGSPAVYAVDASKVTQYFSFTGSECLPSQLLKLTLDEISGFTLEYNGSKTEFAVAAERVETEYTGPDGAARTDVSVRLSVTKNGAEPLSATLFESSFNRLANMKVEGRLSKSDTADRTEAFRITISTPDAAIKSVPLAFYEYSGTQYLVECLGDRTILVSASEADDVLRSFRNAAPAQ